MFANDLSSIVMVRRTLFFSPRLLSLSDCVFIDLFGDAWQLANEEVQFDLVLCVCRYVIQVRQIDIPN